MDIGSIVVAALVLQKGGWMMVVAAGAVVTASEVERGSIQVDAFSDSRSAERRNLKKIPECTTAISTPNILFGVVLPL